MSHSEHTKEPWVIEYLGDAGFTITVEPTGYGDYPPVICQRGPWTHHEADARRIVACVNALAGIPDPPAFLAAHKALVEAAQDASQWILNGTALAQLREALRVVAGTTKGEG